MEDQIDTIFGNIVTFSKRNSNTLAEAMNKLQIQDENEIEKFNQDLQIHIKTIYMKLMSQNNYEDLSLLLQTLFLSLKKKQFKTSNIISLMDYILQCVGISDLQGILKVFSYNLQAYGNLVQADQNKLLKIINHLLKRVSKSQDYFIRGQLQLALTKILPLCHDSGFHRRGLPANATDVQPQNESFSQMDSSGDISYQFYEQFWQLQKYFMNQNELFANNSGQAFERDQTKKPSNSTKTSSLLRLKKINHTLNEVINYFKTHPISESQQLDSSNQPLKFLKIYHLLPLQLNDKYFRVIILIQILIFVHSFKNPSIRVPLEISQEQKQILNQIQKTGIAHLQEITCKSENRQLYENFSKFLRNENQWVELKDNWKQSKKSLYCLLAKIGKQPKSQIQTKRQNAQRQFTQKMGVDGATLKNFLNNRQLFSLKQKPIISSFSTFFSQAESALDSFNMQTGAQDQFETKSEYNLFEWKAMRSLYRENVHELNLVQRNAPKLKQYRLLNVIYRKEQELFDQPRKKVKPNQE